MEDNINIYLWFISKDVVAREGIEHWKILQNIAQGYRDRAILHDVYLFIFYFLSIGRHESRDMTMKDNLREYKLYNLQNQLQCGKLVTKDLRDF